MLIATVVVSVQWNSRAARPRESDSTSVWLYVWAKASLPMGACWGAWGRTGWYYCTTGLEMSLRCLIQPAVHCTSSFLGRDDIYFPWLFLVFSNCSDWNITYCHKNKCIYEESENLGTKQVWALCWREGCGNNCQLLIKLPNHQCFARSVYKVWSNHFTSMIIDFSIFVSKWEAGQ